MSNFATEILAMRKLRQRRLRHETLEERRLLTGGRVVNDLIALYTFDAGSGDTVSDVSGIGEALDLEIDDVRRIRWQPGKLDIRQPTSIVSTEAATKITDAVMASNELTFEAWVTPQNRTQDGPARIATISSNPVTTNFTFGARGGAYEIRHRTTTTGNEGTRPAVRSSRTSVSTELTHVVYARNADNHAYVYVDGRLVSGRRIDGDMSNWDETFSLALGAATTGESPWLGTLDLVAFYSKALDISDVKQNFIAGPDPGVFTGGPPKVVISPVSPTQRSTPVDQVTVTFSEKVFGVEISDFVLRKNGRRVNLSSSLLTRVSDTVYTVDLSTATAAEGDYTFDLIARNAGIVNEDATRLLNDVSLAFYVDSTPPRADIVDVMPDPSRVNPGTIQVIFNEDVEGVDVTDFRVTLNGRGVSLSRATLTENSPREYELGLTRVIGDPGVYEVTLLGKGSNIQDRIGNPFTTGATEQFTIIESPFSARVQDDLLALYAFEAKIGDTVFDVSGTGDPLDLRIDDPSAVVWHPGQLEITGPTSIDSTTSAAKISEVVRRTGEFTIEAWIEAENLNYSGFAPIVSIAGSTADTNMMLSAFGSGYDVRFRTILNPAGTSPSAKSPRNSSTHDLSQVVYTRQSDGMAHLYIDGQLLGSRRIPGGTSNWGSEAPLSIANRLGRMLPWQGKLDLLAIYGEALSLEEIKQNLGAGPDPRVDVGLVADIENVQPDPRLGGTGNVTIQFNQDVTGFDARDLRLTRDGQNVRITSARVTRVSPSEYSVNLSPYTSVPGSYELSLIASGALIRSGQSFLERDAFEEFRVATAPTAFFNVVPAVRNTEVGFVTISFSQDVTGFDISDFQLFRNGQSVSLETARLLQTTPREYRLDLTNVTKINGSYFLRLESTNSDIRNEDGFELSRDATDGFTVTFASPTVDFVDVSPNPRHNPVERVYLNFNEPVDGVSVSDFSLTRNGSFVSLAGARITKVAAKRYLLTLANNADDFGEYRLTLRATNSGIVNDHGASLRQNATTFFEIIQPTAPQVEIIEVIPDPRSSSVGSVTINFDMPVSGFDVSDLRLTRDNAPIVLSGTQLSATTSTSYVLDLDTITVRNGVYRLTLLAPGSGIVSDDGAALPVGAVEEFTIGFVPAIATMVDVSPDPRFDPVDEVVVEFSQQVIGVDVGDFRLTRQGVDIPLDRASVSRQGFRRYMIDLSGIPQPPGQYVLTLRANGSGIENVYGTHLANDTQDAFTIEPPPPPPGPTADILDIVPDPRSEPVGIVTVTFDEHVSGVDLSDFRLLRNNSLVELAGTKEVTSTVEVITTIRVVKEVEFVKLIDGEEVTVTEEIVVDEEVIELQDVVEVVPIVPVVEISPREYTLDLTDVTELPGLYEFSLVKDGSEIQNVNEEALRADAVDWFFVVDDTMASLPVLPGIVGIAENGSPIFEFASTTNGHVITHSGSGDTLSISPDGRYVALLPDDTGSFARGDWYVYDFETRNITKVATIAPGQNRFTGFNYRFMWGPDGNDFIVLEADGLDNPQLVSKDVGGATNWKVNLPTRLRGPDLLNNRNRSISVQWRGGVASGEDVIILEAFVRIGNRDHTYLQALDARTGAELPNSGFWIGDHSNGLATSCHNCWSGLGGIVYSPVSATHQQVIYWSSYDGSQFVQLEPDNLPQLTDSWTHQTFDGNQVLYELSGEGKIVLETYLNGPAPHDDLNGRTTILNIGNSALLPFFPSTTNQHEISYWHGHLVNGKAAMSLLNTETNEYAIVVMDATTGHLTSVAQGLRFTDRGFYSQPRPTLSADHSRVCWHHVAEDGLIKTLCVEL